MSPARIPVYADPFRLGIWLEWMICQPPSIKNDSLLNSGYLSRTMTQLTNLTKVDLQPLVWKSLKQILLPRTSPSAGRLQINTKPDSTVSGHPLRKWGPNLAFRTANFPSLGGFRPDGTPIARPTCRACQPDPITPKKDKSGNSLSEHHPGAYERVYSHNLLLLHSNHQTSFQSNC